MFLTQQDNELTLIYLTVRCKRTMQLVKLDNLEAYPEYS